MIMKPELVVSGFSVIVTICASVGGIVLLFERRLSKVEQKLDIVANAILGDLGK